MTQTLHLLEWDIRRFRVLLSLWLLLVAASAVLEGAWPAMAVALEARQTVTLAGSLLALAEVLFSIVLIALVVQEHPLVGTTAFWMTRPIRSRALLASKLILLMAVFVVAPMFAEIVAMTVYQVPAADVVAVAAQTLFFRTLWLGIVIAFAAPTLNLPKFAFAVGGALIGVWVVLIAVNAVSVDRGADRPPIPAPQDMYDPTPGAVAATLVILSVLAFLFALYRTRARVPSIVLGALGLVAAWAIGSAWTWPLLAPRTEMPAWARDPAALQLSAEPDAVKVRVDGFYGYGYGYDRPEWGVARARLRLSGLAPGWSSEAGMRETSLRVSGRDALVSRVRGPRSSPVLGDAERQKNEVMRGVLNVRRLIDWSEQPSPDSAVIMVARTAELRQLSAERGMYEGRFLLPLTRHDVVAVVPVRAGSSFASGAYHFVLDRIRVRENRISLLVRESDADSLFTRRPSSRVDYYLRNPGTSEAVHALWRPLQGGPTLRRLLPILGGTVDSDRSGFRALAVALECSSSYGPQQQGVVFFDESWLGRGELVIVRSTEAAAVERRLTIADFPIQVN